MNKQMMIILCVGLSVSLVSAQGLATGNRVKISLRGVPAAESAEVNGEYTLGEAGGIRIPGLEESVNARGLTGEQLARKIESAYKAAGIYTKPAVEAVVLTGASVAAVQTFVSIGGQVRKPGKVDFQKNMTLMSAIQASGDRTEFGGNTLFLRRAGKVLKLNYREEAVKNMLLLPDDVISVEERGPFER